MARHARLVSLWLAAVLAAEPGAGPAVRQVAHQGHRRVRGRARQHAGRLRPRRRPERHRRRPAQRALHQAEPGVDARAAGRQHPRRQPQHQERRRGDGHRQPAGLRRRRLADRRHRLGHGRRQEPAGRHPAGHPADGRRRRGLCGGAGHGADRLGHAPRGASGSSVSKGVPTAGRIAAGAIVETRDRLPARPA